MIALLLSLASAMDLDEVRAAATDRAIAVAQAQAAVDVADGTFWQERSTALPNVELFAQVSTGAGLTAFGFERPVATQGAVGATGTWTLIAPAAWASWNGCSSLPRWPAGDVGLGPGDRPPRCDASSR